MSQFVIILVLFLGKILQQWAFVAGHAAAPGGRWTRDLATAPTNGAHTAHGDHIDGMMGPSGALYWQLQASPRRLSTMECFILVHLIS